MADALEVHALPEVPKTPFTAEVIRKLILAAAVAGLLLARPVYSEDDTPHPGPAATLVPLPVEDEPPSTYDGPAIDGYKTVLSGKLRRDCLLGPEDGPVLVRGVLVVPPECTLGLKPGAVLHLAPDRAAKPEPGGHDPTKSGALWVLGRLLADGLTGERERGARIEARNAESAALYFYGDKESEIRGATIEKTGVVQRGGEVRWLGVTFKNAPHYALVSGAALLVQDSFVECGGIFATYDNGPWSLLLSGCRFERGAGGLVLGSNPGAERLRVERNDFEAMAGPCLRAAPVDAKRRVEWLVGENWYGSSQPERVDVSIVDGRSDAALRARINTRPPAEAAYADCGADVPPAVVAQAWKALAPACERLRKAHAKAKTHPEEQVKTAVVPTR